MRIVLGGNGSAEQEELERNLSAILSEFLEEHHVSPIFVNLVSDWEDDQHGKWPWTIDIDFLKNSIDSKKLKLQMARLLSDYESKFGTSPARVRLGEWIDIDGKQWEYWLSVELSS